MFFFLLFNMKKILYITSLLLFTTSVYCQLTVNVGGTVQLSNSNDASEISISVSETLNGYIDTIIHPSSTGQYSFSFDLDLIPILNEISPANLDIQITNSNYDTVWIEDFFIATTGNKVLPTRIMNTAGDSLYQPSICAINTINENNYIAWERANNQDIDYYIVYKANSQQMMYDSIGILDYDSVSVFEDSNLSDAGAETYQIIAVMNDGSKSHVSLEKSSICLEMQTDNNADTAAIMNLSLAGIRDIAGFRVEDYDTITLFKKTGTNSFEILQQHAFSNDNWDQYINFADTVVISDTYYYQVGLSLNQTCTPAVISLLKSESGPYSQSLSNITESTVTIDEIIKLNENNINKLIISYNSNTIDINIPSAGILTIYNTNGQIVSKKQVTQQELTIELNQGFYIVVLNADKIYTGEIIIK